MTVRKTAVIEAAFWDQGICLDCGMTFELEGDGPPAACEDCGSRATVRAEDALEILTLVEDDDDD